MMNDFSWTGETTRRVVKYKLRLAIRQLETLLILLKRMQDVGYKNYPDIEEGIEISVALACQLAKVLETISKKI